MPLCSLLDRFPTILCSAFVYVHAAECEEDQSPVIPKASQKRTSLRSIVSVDTENRITGVRELLDLVGNVSVETSYKLTSH